MRNVVLAALIGAVALWQPTVSHAQLVLYDDFAGPLINPDKWFGTEATGGAGNATSETERFVKSGQLILGLGQYGLSNSDSGRSVGRVRLQFPNSGPLTTIQADLTVAGVEIGTCPTNTDSAATGAAFIIGQYFNDGTSSGAGDVTGDVQATVQKLADSALGNVIRGVVLRCSNSSCSTAETLASQIFTTSWTPGERHTLTLTWDAPNHQFIVSAKASHGTMETYPLPYTVSDSAPPIAFVRELILSNFTPNCNGSQKRVFMSTLWDTVMVNP